jgi:hypothetical protein
MHRSLLSAVLSLSLLLSPLVAAQAAEYTFTTIDVLFLEATSTAVHGVNSSGQMVGGYGSAQGGRGFLDDAGVFTSIAAPGADNTDLWGINNQGQMVGYYNRSIGSELRQGGFLYAAGVLTLLDVPDAAYTQAFGINNHGQIVGVYGIFPSLAQQGFLYSGGIFTPLDLITAWGINDEGQVVGTTSNGSKLVGALDDGGVLTILDVPGSIQTIAQGINNTSKIVGSYSDSRGVNHGFLYTAGAFTTIDVPGAAATEAYGINDANQIVGTYFNANREQHGFLATPVPVDNTPPMITVSASPATLSPPNGKLVTVTVSGTITDEGSGVQASTYQVTDEYSQIQPSGDVTLEPDGEYAFTIALQASRDAKDKDGRRYTIEVSATDHAGTEGARSATVTVPRK